MVTQLLEQAAHTSPSKQLVKGTHRVKNKTKSRDNNDSSSLLVFEKQVKLCLQHYSGDNIDLYNSTTAQDPL